VRRIINIELEVIEYDNDGLYRVDHVVSALGRGTTIAVWIEPAGNGCLMYVRLTGDQKLVGGIDVDRCTEAMADFAGSQLATV
jgi:hypothetical protein